ncbi:hypothetical protein KJ359_004177 [Pestalotiopsis sp. 9143b]|nr:hypothetical protein KJ359_004177 [Pestalotiopsis sp. 9143b]
MAPAHGQRPTSGRSAPATADFQYETSNKTVNKFLGGRQRAWMTAPTVLPTPAASDEPSPAVPATVEATSSPQASPSASTASSLAPVTSAHFELITALAPTDIVEAESPDVQEPHQQAQNSAIVTGQALAATAGANEAGNYVAGAPYLDLEAVRALQTPPTPSTSTIAPLPAALPPSPNVSEGRPAKRQRVG